MVENTQVTWLTQEAYDRLQSELDYLSNEGRVEIAKKLRLPEMKATSKKMAAITQQKKSRACRRLASVSSPNC